MTTENKIGVILAIIVFGGLLYDAYLYLSDPVNQPAVEYYVTR